VNRVQELISAVLIRSIHAWLFVCGRPVRRSDVPWLASPTGPRDRIGERWYWQLAEKERLTVRTPPGAGLLARFDELRGPAFDPALVHPAIRRFYEHTSQFNLEAWSEVTLYMRFFLWGLVTFASRRMQQLNFPVSSMELATGMSSEVLQLDAEDGTRRYTGWLRRMKANGLVLYAGLYTIGRVPAYDGPCVKVSFPVPLGSSTVFLRPENAPEGAFRLISQGQRFGDCGFYRFVERGTDRYQVRYLKTLRERFHVYLDGDGVLRTDHSIRYLGLPVMRLHYKIVPAARDVSQAI
jgi:hypothetical protein